MGQYVKECVKKVLGALALSSLLLSGACADDILAIVSKGQLTSNSVGVKELSLEEKMQVKGGMATSRDSVMHYFWKLCCW